MPLSPHTRLGPYEIVSAIGAGGMGEVYKARDTRLDRTVAIKVLPEHRSTSPQLRERFEREAKAISSLSHPHICPLYDVGHQDGIDYLVMEYLEGQTLADRLKKGPLPLEQVLQYAIQITDALDTAHKHAVIHRDLKPGNIMLTKSGAKLLDFGLAKVRVAEAAAGVTALPTETSPLTSEGTILGTLQYMAPEQLEGKEADVRTDIFALGAVIYEMATERKAFEGKSQASLISAIMSAQPAPLSTLQPLATPLLERVVGKCLSKDPEERWHSARDLEDELKWIAAGMPAAKVVAPDAARLRKRERLVWIVAAGLLTSLVATWAIVELRRAPEARVVRFEITLGENTPSQSQPLLPAISPDGQYVAIQVNEGGDRRRIWLHPLNSLASHPLPGTEGGLLPFWSPDSRQIGFSTGSTLKRIGLAGGSAETICNRRAFGPGAWNRSGVILFATDINQPLSKVNAQGGEPEAFTKLDRSREETGHLFPQFLPDGRHFIYLALGSHPATYLGSLDSPEVKRIREGNTNAAYAPPGYLIFLRGPNLMAQPFDLQKAELSGDAVLLAETPASVFGSSYSPAALIRFPYYADFSVSKNGLLAYVTSSSLARTELVWFDRTGKRLGTVGDPADYTNPAISPDQEKVAVGKRDPQTNARDIWVIDLQRGASARFTFDPGDDFNPTWSPDGARIAFSSDRKGHRDIYVKAASGLGDEVLLLQSAEDKSIEDWSADGQYLVYGTDPGEWFLSLAERKPMPLLQGKGKFPGDQIRFFPSRGSPPRWFAYTDESGAPQVYVSSFAAALSGSGGKWQISTNGGTEPIWRRDGKELFYLNGNKLTAAEVNGDGDSFQAGIPKELFEVPLPGQRRNRYDVSADGRRFLMNALVEQKGAKFVVVENWPALLKP